MKILSIGIFGILGVMARYFIDAKFSSPSTTLPYTTFFINMLGCFIAGIVTFYVYTRQDQILATGILVGFCGGLTTFSGYSLQSLNLFTQGFGTRAFLYLTISPAFGVFFAFLGYQVALGISSINQ